MFILLNRCQQEKKTFGKMPTINMDAIDFNTVEFTDELVDALKMVNLVSQVAVITRYEPDKDSRDSYQACLQVLGHAAGGDSLLGALARFNNHRKKNLGLLHTKVCSGDIDITIKILKVFDRERESLDKNKI